MIVGGKMQEDFYAQHYSMFIYAGNHHCKTVQKAGVLSAKQQGGWWWK